MDLSDRPVLGLDKGGVIVAAIKGQGSTAGRQSSESQNIVSELDRELALVVGSVARRRMLFWSLARTLQVPAWYGGTLCRFASSAMRDVGRWVVSQEEDLLRDANSMYWYASEAGLFSDDDNVDERVTYYGAEFLQLADALEVRQDNVDQKRQFEELIVEAAQALLTGNPVPEWYSDANSDLHHGRAPWKVSSVPHHEEGESSFRKG